MKSIAWAIIVAALIHKECGENIVCGRVIATLWLISVCGFLLSLLP